MSQKSKIKSIRANEILDSKGRPTVEAILETDLGIFRASVASGISTGKYEALELRDESGGVKQAINNIENIITPALKGKDADSQKKIDEVLIRLDGTKNKSRLGANAILPVSMAVCRAGAASHGLSLYQYIKGIFGFGFLGFVIPLPSFNMVEGGKHADSQIAFQEFMVVPQHETFKEQLEAGKLIHNALGKIFKEKHGDIRLSAEGAWAAPLEKISDVLDAILEAGGNEKFKIAIDAAASEFFSGEENAYRLEGKMFSKEQLLDFYNNLINKYPLNSIEDPFFEEDFAGFAILKKTAGAVIIIGDDLTVSNMERIKIAEEKKACSGLILKPNQIGTVTETIAAARLAKSFNWKIMVANRAGETEDDFIADLAVGINAEFIKSGAPFPKERMAKYNRLVRIEEELILTK